MNSWGWVCVILALLQQGTNYVLSWAGGTPPYQVQIATDLSFPNW
jgi:hypothetical protein